MYIYEVKASGCFGNPRGRGRGRGGTPLFTLRSISFGLSSFCSTRICLGEGKGEEGGGGAN